MKFILSMAFVLFALNGFAQAPAEAGVLKLSADIFKWETERRIDSLDKTFDEKFVVVNAKGIAQTKDQYITLLSGGTFVHNSINIEQSSVIIANNSATVYGKGTFVIVNNGNKITLHLSYLEVFTRPDNNSAWKILAIHASALDSH